MRQYETLLKQALPQSPSSSSSSSASSTKDQKDHAVAGKRETQLLFTSTKVVVARAFNDLESMLDDCAQSPRMAEDDAEACAATSLLSQRYHGEVSDVRFFNMIKGLLDTKSPAISEQEYDSYEQEGEAIAGNKIAGQPVSLPSLDGSFKYIEVYFSTIHLAYPFLAESVFIERYYGTQHGPTQHQTIGATDLALFCLFYPVFYTRYSTPEC